MDTSNQVTGYSPPLQLRQQAKCPYRIKMICILFLKDLKIKLVEWRENCFEYREVTMENEYHIYWLKIPQKCTMQQNVTF